MRNNPDAPPLLKLFANAMHRYHSGEVRFVKLLDGGIVDNYGLAGFTIARLAANTPYGPLEPKEAVKLRRLLFLVVDAGRAPSGAWSQTVEGPSGVNLITAASDTATESGAVGSYSAFQDTMNEWQNALIDWRCKLSPTERRHFGAPTGWNCRDVKIFVGRVAFDQLGPQRAAALNSVQTAFKLPPDQVEMVISAGHDAVQNSSVFRSFLARRAGGGSGRYSAGGLSAIKGLGLGERKRFRVLHDGVVRHEDDLAVGVVLVHREGRDHVDLVT